MTNIAILNQCRHTTSDLVLPMDENLAARLLDSGEIELSTLAPVVVTETESETLVSLVSERPEVVRRSNLHQDKT